MKMNDAFPSRYMKADDLEDGDLTVTIRDGSPVEWEEFTQKGKPTPDNKPVLYFKSPREAKALVLNKTNWKTIAQVLGTDETEDWGGKSITLYATEVESFGEMTMAVRVRLRKPEKAKATAASVSSTAAESPVLGEIKALISGWADQNQIGAEIARQLKSFDAARISELTEAQLPRLKEGIDLWIKKQSDEIPF